MWSESVGVIGGGLEEVENEDCCASESGGLAENSDLSATFVLGGRRNLSPVRIGVGGS